MEIERGLEAAEREPRGAAVQRFATTVTSIRWSDPRIANLVHTFVQIEAKRRHRAQLDVCRAIRDWVASGYRKVPVSTSAEPPGAIEREWAREMAALGCRPFSSANPSEVLRALRLYQRPDAQPTTRQIELLEVRLVLEESLVRADAARSLGRALGIRVPRSKRSRRRHSSTAVNAPAEPPGCSGRPEPISEQ
jgi:hypothetical protein